MKVVTYMTSNTVSVRRTLCDASASNSNPPSCSATAVMYPGQTSNLKIIVFPLYYNSLQVFK